MRISPSFIRFSIIGVLNTTLDVGIFSLLSHAGWSLFVANLISTSMGLSLSFVLNRRFTFNSRDPKRRQIIPFLVVTLSGLWILQPVVIYSIMLFAPADAPTALTVAAKLVATIGTLIWNYLWYRKIFSSHDS